ncbi:hypothetical protein LEP1GSC043_2737 [Leptospira weilii str. Ecochallenge]|uniref:Uncharacterized protein n=1 Tax=Leptospira weilii str. Ecochallenge TaxID=1049986 RepID=N1U4J4_9LEPT|nr:hypothetical protein LEP1GSC043_2737 [Leptospira weilii str. Ecochallenge]
MSSQYFSTYIPTTANQIIKKQRDLKLDAKLTLIQLAMNSIPNQILTFGPYVSFNLMYK